MDKPWSIKECKNCGIKNRIPREAVGLPKCGNCGLPLATEGHARTSATTLISVIKDWRIWAIALSLGIVGELLLDGGGWAIGIALISPFIFLSVLPYVLAFISFPFLVFEKNGFGWLGFFMWLVVVFFIGWIIDILL